MKSVGESMLNGKTVIVTGGARGIGKAISLKFAEKGANVVVNYISNEPVELIQQIEQMGVSCLAVQADIGVFTEAEYLVKKTLERFDMVDVLVNNAGITKDYLLMRMSEDMFDRVIETNLKGTFNTIRHVVAKMMKQRSGAIINMSSVVGLAGNIGQVNYAASKAGIIGLTKSVAKELAGRGITCNAVAPGFIETEMTEALPETIAKKQLEAIPLNRYGRPEEVAEVVVFLACSPYITGQVIQIDGGMLM